MKRVLQEALLVGIMAAILAFAANAVSPRGLQLGKNYFRGGGTASSTAATGPVATTSGTNAIPIETLAERFAKEDLQLADSNRVNQLFGDPRRQQDLIVFIDARPEEHYLEGHIPGAYHYDRFHPETFLPVLLPICQAAEQIVFYCSGGDCEESEHAALDVRAGMNLPKEKVFVYGGGINEWQTNRMPVEIGQRNSGNITNAAITR